MLSVVMSVNDPDCPTFTIQRWDVAVAPSGFAEIVCDDFPILHAQCTFTDSSQPLAVRLGSSQAVRSLSVALQ